MYAFKILNKILLILKLENGVFIIKFFIWIPLKIVANILLILQQEYGFFFNDLCGCI